MSTRRNRVVVVDDHPIVLAGIKALIQESGDFELVGDANSGEQGFKVIASEVPDLAVVDLSMPGMNGAELVRRVVDTVPSVMLVVLTVHEEPAYVQQVIKAGARAYLLKRSAADELLRALRAVVASGIYIDPVVAAKMLASSTRVLINSADLSEREEEVLRAAARGFSNKELATRLGLSTKTVDTYKARGMEKLNFRTRAELVRYAAAHGWMSDA